MGRYCSCEFFHFSERIMPPVRIMYRQPSTRLQNSTPKLAWQNPESISQEVIYHGTLTRTSSRYQVFEKPVWEPSEDASKRSSWNLFQIASKLIPHNFYWITTIFECIWGAPSGPPICKNFNIHPRKKKFKWKLCRILFYNGYYSCDFLIFLNR